MRRPSASSPCVIAEAGDLEAARQLVTSNLRLVVKIAYDYRRAYRNVMDLIQEGNIGLMQAVKKYDPYKGSSSRATRPGGSAPISCASSSTTGAW